MDRQRLSEIARGAMADGKTDVARERGYTFWHGLRTARIAERLLARLGGPVEVDADVVFAGALLHDVGKPAEPHNEVGAERAAELLAGVLTGGQVEAVARIVREHNRRSSAAECWTASRVVQDADVLDHFGAQSIWLCFHWSAAHEESCEDALAFYRGAENAAYLARSRQALSFDASREAFDERVAFERRFFDRFARELDPGP